MTTQKIKDQRRERENRMVRLEQLCKQGLTSPSELAPAFGVSVPVIIRDIKCIERDILRRTRKDKRVKRNWRIEQMDSVQYAARDAFIRSQDNTEETSTTRKTCEICGGNDTGDKPCVPCGGTGMIIVETVKTRGEAGDSAFLRIAAQCIRESAKLEGLYQPRKAGGSVGYAENALINNLHMHTSLHDDDVNASPFQGAPAELLIEAVAALAKVRDAMPGPRSTIVVTAKPTEESE